MITYLRSNDLSCRRFIRNSLINERKFFILQTQKDYRNFLRGTVRTRRVQ